MSVIEPRRKRDVVAKRAGALARLLAAALMTAVLTVAIFTVLSGQSRSFNKQLSANAETTRDGVASLICILNIVPEDRTPKNIKQCLELNGFDAAVLLDVGGDARGSGQPGPGVSPGPQPQPSPSPRPSPSTSQGPSPSPSPTICVLGVCI